MSLIHRLGEPDTRGIIIQTRQGNPIKNSKGKPLSQYHRDNAELELKRTSFTMATIFPDKRKEATDVYNCHGLTFLNRRAILREEEEILKILDDDEYFVVSRSDVTHGDIVIYYDRDGDITHTGIVVRIEIDAFTRERNPMVLSKWGGAGEYIHIYSFSPYTTQKYAGWTVKFMREGQND